MVPAVKIGLFALVAVGAAGVIANRKLIFPSRQESSRNRGVDEKPETKGKSTVGEQQRQDSPSESVVVNPSNQPQRESEPSNPTPSAGGGEVENQRTDTATLTPPKTTDYQCKFGNDEYENSPNKKELKEFLESKGGYGLQILGDGKGEFKCAKDYENDSDLAGLKNFLENNEEAKSSFSNTLNTKNTNPLPIAVKKKAGESPSWTIMGPDDENPSSEEILAPVQAPAS